MDRWLRIGLSALITGTAASVVSTAALALLAQKEGKSAFQPTNATSHWLHGDPAASHREPDVSHTFIGYATHHASALFWAMPFEIWLAARPPRTTAGLLRNACMMSAIALARVVSVGIETADMLVQEVLSRQLRDPRAVARYGGLTGSPEESGVRRREQGLARAGNARVRRGMLQFAWRFPMFQKDSALAQWYRARTAVSSTHC